MIKFLYAGIHEIQSDFRRSSSSLDTVWACYNWISCICWSLANTEYLDRTLNVFFPFKLSFLNFSLGGLPINGIYVVTGSKVSLRYLLKSYTELIWRIMGSMLAYPKASARFQKKIYLHAASREDLSAVSFCCLFSLSYTSYS